VGKFHWIDARGINPPASRAHCYILIELMISDHQPRPRSGGSALNRYRARATGLLLTKGFCVSSRAASRLSATSLIDWYR
jgi:hypothetical protein